MSLSQVRRIYGFRRSRRDLCWNLLANVRVATDYPIVRRGQGSDRMGFSRRLCHASTLRVTIWLEASSAQNSMAALSAQGSKGWVLMRRLNSSCRRSTA